MSKVRSKLKRHTAGKTWKKGHSATSNPQQMKHRVKAKSRFFQANLSLAPSDVTANAGSLTVEALQKHEQREMFDAETATVNDVASSMKNFNLSDHDGDMTMSGDTTTQRTFKTFASTYSMCSNMSFNKLLSGFCTSSELHKEMLAILTALTEIIKERGGTETSTEYFILLMEQLDACTADSEYIAGLSLLAMGIKSVPKAVLRKVFSKSAEKLIFCLEHLINSNTPAVIKSIIVCLSVLLRAQDYTTWSYSSTWKYIDAILSLTMHTKPKIRKAAQHALISIVHGSSFMLSPKSIEESSQDEAPAAKVDSNEPQVKFHPASGRITKFFLNQSKPEMLVHKQTTILHALSLVKDTISGLKTDDIRAICEHLLSIMTATNVLVRTICFQVFYSLFTSHTDNLNGDLCAKLLVAIHEYRPDRSDVRQTLAWVTTLKQGHIHLSVLDFRLCMNALPHFIEVCTTDLWMSDRNETIISASVCLKELLYECVKSACATLELAEQYKVQVGRIITLLTKSLHAPFGDVAKYVIITFSYLFEICGKYFSAELMSGLSLLAKRYDTQNSLRIQIEHAIIAAIKSMGPQLCLQAIPLTNAKGEVVIERSWLLPLLREGTIGTTFKFFKEVVLMLALDCNTKWNKAVEEKDLTVSHTYELLCCQLWGLFPGCCRQPKDPQNFALIAPTLGNALDNNVEFRAPIFDGLLELLKNEDEPKIHEVLNKYAKNFVPRLFNIYLQKPTGTYEADLRKKCLEVIKLYLTKTSENILKELLETGINQIKNTTPGTFEYEAIFDATSALVPVQASDTIRVFFETFIVPILKNTKSDVVSKDGQKLKRQQRKTYELLRDILCSETEQCQKFTRQNLVALQKLLLEAFATSCCVCQAARLRCLKMVIERRKGLMYNDKIVIKTIPEVIVTFREFSTKKENISEELIKLISDLYKESEKLNDFIDVVATGFTGDEALIANTILALRCITQHQGKNLTISTLDFILDQILVFLVQRSRPQAEAATAFLITFIKVMPVPLIAKRLENIVRSLSAMSKDTKRYCRIHIGYLLKKLCKRFSAQELIKFVPGDDEVTHRRLKKIRKQLRRDNRKKLIDAKDDDDDNDADEDDALISRCLEKKSVTINDILDESESDLSDIMKDDDDDNVVNKKKVKKDLSTYIREEPEDVVDLTDIKSIGNVLTNYPDLSTKIVADKTKQKDANRGFKTARDGRLIINDKDFRKSNENDDDENNSDDESEDDDDDDDDLQGTAVLESKKPKKRGIEIEDSSDEEGGLVASTRKRKSTEAFSLQSGKTGSTRYTHGGKGIHRSLTGGASSMKSGHSQRSRKSSNTAAAHSSKVYSSKKAGGDMKKKGKLDPYTYIPLSRNSLNKRKRAKNVGAFKNIIKGARKTTLKGVKAKVKKAYKK